MDLAKRFAWIVGGLALVGCLTIGVVACNDATITNDDRQRCCTCLETGGCLEDTATVTSCREELTNEGSTEFDADCESENCGRECDFLYW